MLLFFTFLPKNSASPRTYQLIIKAVLMITIMDTTLIIFFIFLTFIKINLFIIWLILRMYLHYLRNSFFWTLTFLCHELLDHEILVLSKAYFFKITIIHSTMVFIWNCWNVSIIIDIIRWTPILIFIITIGTPTIPILALLSDFHTCIRSTSLPRRVHIWRTNIVLLAILRK